MFFKGWISSLTGGSLSRQYISFAPVGEAVKDIRDPSGRNTHRPPLVYILKLNNFDISNMWLNPETVSSYINKKSFNQHKKINF
jgi:hypothetical protein